MNTAHKTIKNKPRRLNMQITELSACIITTNYYLPAHNRVIYRLRDSRIYMHVIDQSQCIKQLQCIMKFFMSYTFDFLPFFYGRCVVKVYLRSELCTNIFCLIYDYQTTHCLILLYCRLSILSAEMPSK